MKKFKMFESEKYDNIVINFKKFIDEENNIRNLCNDYIRNFMDKYNIFQIGIYKDMYINDTIPRNILLKNGNIIIEDLYNKEISLEVSQIYEIIQYLEKYETNRNIFALGMLYSDINYTHIIFSKFINEIEIYKNKKHNIFNTAINSDIETAWDYFDTYDFQQLIFENKPEDAMSLYKEYGIDESWVIDINIKNEFSDLFESEGLGLL